jgi:(p)ppGpp synthase/HD superfamily hydrolase
MESKEIILDKCQRHTIAIRHTLLGKGWMTALEAMEFASNLHKGSRKDKITPEFYHQIEIAGFLMTLADGLILPEDTIATAFLHDVSEDYDVGFEELGAKFGSRITNAVNALTKKHRGKKVSPEVYFENIQFSPIASIVKGADRINNQSSIVGIFSRDKQNAYVVETEQFILPMLKSARKMHPKQYNAYLNVMFVLKSQLDMICAVHAAMDADKHNNLPVPGTGVNRSY